MVGGTIYLPGRSAPPGVEEALLPGLIVNEGNQETQDDNPAQQTEAGSSPANVQRVAEGHEVLGFVCSYREPDGCNGAKHSCFSRRMMIVLKDKKKNKEKVICF